jgi:glutamyl-tRNA synthetase/glutamyl-Q tRNA(Asp) synthetase
VNAVYVWGVAKALGGQVLLRLEDHDRIRCRPEYEAALIEDLAWLGFAPATAAWTRQRERSPVYEQALEQLRHTAEVYVCDCSRKDIGGECYPGRCRTRGLADGRGRGLRVVMPPGAERFDDMQLGAQEQHPAAQCGDLLLRDRDGHWTYQFAVTVDDWRQQITHVIRGADLLTSTGRQLRLARMLGRAAPPRFLHHPLIVKPSGEKLSKSDSDTGVRELRAEGLRAADVIGRAAAQAGLIPVAMPLAADEVGALFQGAALRRTY